MKIVRNHGWIKIVGEDSMVVEAICLDYPKRDMRQQVKEHIAEQEQYIKRLQTRLEVIRKVFAG